jgi:hypothetical protein
MSIIIYDTTVRTNPKLEFESRKHNINLDLDFQQRLFQEKKETPKIVLHKFWHTV